MSNIVTYNIKLKFSSNEEKNLLILTLLEHQKVWNHMSNFAFSMKKLDKKILHDKNYHPCRSLFPNCPSQIIIRAVNSVYATYKTIKTNNHKLEQPATQKNLSLRLDKRIYTFLQDNKIKLTTTGKRITCSYSTYDKFQELFSKYSLCDPLIFMKDNEFWLATSFEIPSPTLIENSCIGIDLGIKRLITTSEGIAISDKKFLKEKRKLRYIKRILQSKTKTTFSRSANKKIKSLKKKEHNKNRNQCHLMANKILSTKSNVVVMEDLTGIKSTDKGRRFNNRQAQVLYAELRRIITYKAPLRGKVVVTVDPYYTSRNDWRGIERGERKGCRYYASDGKVWDADWNAAINIARKYVQKKEAKGNKLPVSFSVPLDGRLNLVGRPCQLANCEIMSRKFIVEL